MTTLTAFRELLTNIAEPWQEWRERAACRGMDPELWFPERGHTNAEAKAVCATCPVQSECRDHAVEHRELWGIWGGTSERRRKTLRAKRANAAPIHGTYAYYVRGCRCDSPAALQARLGDRRAPIRDKTARGPERVR